MRRVVNQFTAEKPGGIKVNVQEWCRVRTPEPGVAIYYDRRLITTIGAAVFYDPAADQFTLGDGSPLKIDDPRADETRRRATNEN